VKYFALKMQFLAKQILFYISNFVGVLLVTSVANSKSTFELKGSITLGSRTPPPHLAEIMITIII